MRLFTALICLFVLVAPTGSAQELEGSFNPTHSADLNTAFPVYSQNGARGVSGPWDLDRDGKPEVLVAQHNSAGGRIHVVENTGANTWELVYSTAFVDSSANSNNARYAVGADLDGDGNWEIVYVSGNGYNRDRNPDYRMGVYVWEHDGTVGSDQYGSRPATIGDFYTLDGLAVASAHAQTLDAKDLDGDGRHELLVPANGPNANDIFYVLSVTGAFEMDKVGETFETWNVELSVGPRLDGNRLGGGSPSGMYAGDFNGDGNMDISFHAWNNFVLFNATTSGAGLYELPGATDPFFKATASDDVALFGGVVYDIDGDGNDEVFYANFMKNRVTVMDYAQGEDVLEINADNVGADAIAIGGAGGITVGDLDQDGNPELIVGGGGFSATSMNNGLPSRFIRVAEYNGGDPKSGDSYTVYSINTSTWADTLSLHRIERDSMGVKSTRYATASSKQGVTQIGDDPIFPSGIAYLGDSDGDGDVEVALSFQGVDDSLYVYDERWTTFERSGQADTSYYVLSVREAIANPRRDFVRIYSFGENFALNSEARVVLPSDYVLEGNYPNPFNRETTIRFRLPVAKQISARIYDLQGRLVRTLVGDQLYEAGPHEVVWDGTSDAGGAAASGVYLIRLEYGNFSQSKTLVLVK